MDKFWMVYGHSCGAPTVRHVSLESARKEAERLAKQHPNTQFTVLESVCTASVTQTVSIEDHDTQEQGGWRHPFNDEKPGTPVARGMSVRCAGWDPDCGFIVSRWGEMFYVAKVENGRPTTKPIPREQLWVKDDSLPF